MKGVVGYCLACHKHVIFLAVKFQHKHSCLFHRCSQDLYPWEDLYSGG